MIDRFGRQLTYLRVSLIDRCNLRCFYCMPNGPRETHPSEALLTFDEIAALGAVFAELGIRKIRLTGGEPLLRRGVPELVRRLRAIGGIREIVMTTNGVLLSRFARELKEAGLDRVNVSLDTLDRETFRRVTGWDLLPEVLAGLEAASQAGLQPVKVNAVLMKGVNDHAVLDLVEYAAARGFEMRFIEWMPTDRSIHGMRESLFVDSEAARRLVETRFKLIADPSEPHSPARSYFLSGTATRVGFISPLSNAFCASCNRLRLKADGMLKTCLHGREDLDLKALLRGGRTREHIVRAIKETVFERPKEHFLNERAVPHNDFVMTSVGG